MQLQNDLTEENELWRQERAKNVSMTFGKQMRHCPDPENTNNCLLVLKIDGNQPKYNVPPLILQLETLHAFRLQNKMAFIFLGRE